MTEPFPPDEETKAIKAAQEDPAAFAFLYRLYVKPVYRYLYSRLGNAGDAEDLTSQVFMEALKSLPRYRHRGHFRAWLFSIVRHRLINFRNRSRQELDIRDDDLQQDTSLDPLAQTLRNEEKQALLSLIRQLKQEEQDLLRLRFVAELSFAEIGVVMGRSKEAVKKQLYRLLDRLECHLEKDHD